MSVAKHFRERPFSVRGGSLSRGLGDDRFIPYSSVRKLKEKVQATFDLPVSFRLVFGPYGAGKTWTFAWLWREMQQETGSKKCLVLGVPRFEIRAHPERSFVESLMCSAVEEHPELIPLGVSNGGARASLNLRSVRDHLQDWDSRQVLLGQGSGHRVKAPTSDGRSFSMNKLGDLTQLVLAVLEAAGHVGYSSCLILVDEVDAPFLLLGLKDRTIFTEFLRGVYDALVEPPEKGPSYPHAQFLFSGTYQVYQEFEPGAITRKLDEGDLMAAFLRRTEPAFVLDPPSDSDLHQIAQQEIARTRKKPEKGTIPFDEEALAMAWKKSSLNLAQFVRIVSDMYAMAEAEDAKSVTTRHCTRVLAALGQDSEPS